MSSKNNSIILIYLRQQLKNPPIRNLKMNGTRHQQRSIGKASYTVFPGQRPSSIFDVRSSRVVNVGSDLELVTINVHMNRILGITQDFLNCNEELSQL